MEEHFFKIDDKIEKGKYVQIMPVKEDKPVYFACGQIKPLTDQAVKCLIANFQDKQLITSDDLFIDKTSQLEFSGSTLPHDILLENNSFLSITDNATLEHVEIRGESEVYLSDHAKMKYLKINDQASICLGNDVYLHDNQESFYNGVWNLCHLQISLNH